MLILLCQAEHQFKDCLFIENNSSAVQLIFEDFKEEYTHDDCFEKINDETFANNVKFLKISGSKIKNIRHQNLTADPNLSVLEIAKHLKSVRAPDHNLTADLQLSVEEITKHFKGVRALDISYNRNFPNFWIMVHFKNLIFLNASHNDIFLMYITSPLQEIDLSFNYMPSITPFWFMNVPDLKVVDLSSNQVGSIEEAFDFNGKLEVVKLGNNSLSHIGCNTLKLLERSVSIDGEIYLIDDARIDTTCMGDRLKVFVENENVVMRSVVSHKELRIKKKTFNELSAVKFGANQLTNTTEIVDLLGLQLEELTVNGNFIGKLKSNMFQRFNKLRILNLSQTNLTEFKTDPFINIILEMDISYNNLTNADFSSNIPFYVLKSLNVNHNNLAELTGLTKTAYPQLKNIFIEGNRFTCEYISNFKQSWSRLEVIGDPCKE